MGIKNCVVNIDYESQLFDKDYTPLKYQKFNQALEHIFFYINQDTNNFLQAKVNYTDVYLKSIEKLSFRTPQISSPNIAGEFSNWWGALNDLPLEKKINSKIFSAQLASSLNLPMPKQWVVKELAQLQKHVASFDSKNWLLRDPYKMSGQGAHKFKKDELNKNINLFQKILNQQEMLLNVYCDRIVDLGFTFNLDQSLDEVFFIVNAIDERLTFAGGELYLNEEEFYKNYPAINFEKIMPELRACLKKIVLHCQQLGAKGFLQIDTFVYRDENNQIKFNPLVEINYRRTMGQLLYACKPLAQKKVVLRRVVDQNGFLGVNISPPEFKHQIYVEII